MKKLLSESYLAFLHQYDFDEKTFDWLVEQLRDKTISKAKNQFDGQLEVPDYSIFPDLTTFPSDAAERYKKQGLAAVESGQFAVAIANGGMATRFGGVVKGLVLVAGDLSFLDLKLNAVSKLATQVNKSIPVYLMNSFSTEEETYRYLTERKYFERKEIQILCFSQGISLRLTGDQHIYKSGDGNPSFYAPGHGDFIESFKRSGMLDDFLSRQGKVLLLSNVDNILSDPDPAIIGFHLEAQTEITCEIVKKNAEDRGGVPLYAGGVLQIMEDFRLPETFDRKAVPVFNTNTFTLSAAALQKEYDLTWFYVEKVLKEGESPIVQCEQLIGEITAFNQTQYLCVPRQGGSSRFLPIKTRQDLDDARDFIFKIASSRGMLSGQS